MVQRAWGRRIVDEWESGILRDKSMAIFSPVPVPREVRWESFFEEMEERAQDVELLQVGRGGRGLWTTNTGMIAIPRCSWRTRRGGNFS